LNSHVVTSTIAPLKKLSAEYSTALLFVLIWSTGFIVAKLGLPFAPTLTFLSLRYAGVLVLLVPLAILMRADWPKGHMWHIAFAGVLVQAGYLSGVWCAIKFGMPAGLSALIVGLQPLLTGFAAGFSRLK